MVRRKATPDQVRITITRIHFGKFEPAHVDLIGTRPYKALMRSFIIHMEGSTNRLPNVRRLLSDLPDARIVPAVNGRDPIQIATVNWSNGTMHRPHYPFALTPAEIGVFQSHRACWQRIVDDNLDYALIAEDDLRVDPENLGRALKLVQDHGTTDMYIRLPVKQRETAVQTLGQISDMAFVLPRIVGLQCICQIVGRGAAQRLLKVTEQIDRPVDTLLQMHWVTNQPVHAILPNGNREVAHEIGGSTIQTKIKGPDKLAREWRRALYRLALFRHPQKPR